MNIGRLVTFETRMTFDTALRQTKAFVATHAYRMNTQLNRDLVIVHVTTDEFEVEPYGAA